MNEHVQNRYQSTKRPQLFPVAILLVWFLFIFIVYTSMTSFEIYGKSGSDIYKVNNSVHAQCPSEYLPSDSLCLSFLFSRKLGYKLAFTYVLLEDTTFSQFFSDSKLFVANPIARIAPTPAEFYVLKWGNDVYLLSDANELLALFQKSNVTITRKNYKAIIRTIIRHFDPFWENVLIDSRNDIPLADSLPEMGLRFLFKPEYNQAADNRANLEFLTYRNGIIDYWRLLLEKDVLTNIERHEIGYGGEKLGRM